MLREFWDYRGHFWQGLSIHPADPLAVVKPNPPPDGKTSGPDPRTRAAKEA